MALVWAIVRAVNFEKVGFRWIENLFFHIPLKKKLYFCRISNEIPVIMLNVEKMRIWQKKNSFPKSHFHIKRPLKLDYDAQNVIVHLSSRLSVFTTIRKICVSENIIHNKQNKNECECENEEEEKNICKKFSFSLFYFLAIVTIIFISFFPFVVVVVVIILKQIFFFLIYLFLFLFFP